MQYDVRNSWSVLHQSWKRTERNENMTYWLGHSSYKGSFVNSLMRSPFSPELFSIGFGADGRARWSVAWIDSPHSRAIGIGPVMKFLGKASIPWRLFGIGVGIWLKNHIGDTYSEIVYTRSTKRVHEITITIDFQEIEVSVITHH